MGAGELEAAGSLTGPERPPDLIRAFFGLPLPEAPRAALGPYLEACAAAAPEFRWVGEANLHLTLRFMGTVERALALGIAEQLTGAHPAGFTVELGELGTFQRGRLSRVVWIGLRAGAEATRGLAQLVEEACVVAGLAAEARPLEPHLTLGRARAQEGALLPPLPTLPRLEAWTANGLVLYQSRLGRAGSTYEELATVSLSPPRGS